MKMNSTLSCLGKISLAAALTLWLNLSASAQTNRLRIGIYDSRAVAVAYMNSTEFAAKLKAVHAEYDAAKQAGDTNKLKQIEVRMKASQARAHEEGFSTGSVAEIMATVKDAVPGVAKSAGVELIASKWEVNYQSANIETVDVTGQLTVLFHTSDRGRKWAQKIQARPPLSREALDEHQD